MDRQKYLGLIADRLRERGVLDSELDKPLGDFEQYLIENDSDELEESLSNPDEFDDLVENFHQLILKRREILKRRKLERERSAQAQNVAPQPMPEAQSTPEQAPEESAQPQYDDDSDMKLAVDTSSDPAEYTKLAETTQYTEPNEATQTPISFDEIPSEDLSATTTIDRVQLREAQSRQSINPDNSATRTMDAITPEQLQSLGQMYNQNQPQTEAPQSQQYTEPQQMPPVNLNEPPRKLTRSEKRQESLHMYEDLPRLSRDDDNEFGQIDPNAFDYAPTSPKSSALFWVVFILTLPLTIPIIAAFGLVFIAVFLVMAVLIIGLLASLVVDVVVGTALSLIGIIYGITQTFTVVPIGLYEIGLGIVIGGAAMLVGILVYNAAVRLLPFLCRKWYEFFCFIMGQIKRLFNYLRRETAKK